VLFDNGVDFLANLAVSTPNTPKAAARIDRDERGEVLASGDDEFWSGYNGMQDEYTCTDWTSVDQTAAVGNADPDTFFSSKTMLRSCEESRRVLCLQTPVYTPTVVEPPVNASITMFLTKELYRGGEMLSVEQADVFCRESAIVRNTLRLRDGTNVNVCFAYDVCLF
jgi:hypothetical protein